MFLDPFYENEWAALTAETKIFFVRRAGEAARAASTPENKAPLDVLAHFAACQGEFTDVLELLQEGADVNSVLAGAKQPGDTILHIACKSRETTLQQIQSLIDVGASVFMRDEQGNLPLHLIAARWNVDATNCLLLAAKQAFDRKLNDSELFPSIKDYTFACNNKNITPLLDAIDFFCPSNETEKQIADRLATVKAITSFASSMGKSALTKFVDLFDSKRRAPCTLRPKNLTQRFSHI